MANTAIGECSISLNESAYLFRPSFYALSKVNETSNPLDIAKRLLVLNASKHDDMQLSYDDVALCLTVMYSAYNGSQDDLDGLLGYLVESSVNQGRILYKQGLIPQCDLVTIANYLIQMMLIGKPKVKRRGSADDNVIIDPTQFVGCAIDKLKLSISDAWNMTMIEFQRAIESKIPEIAEEKGMTEDKYESLLEKVKARGYH